jgi:uncharacterized membrane protein
MIPEPATFIFAFIVVPAIVVAVGYIAVRLHERSLDRDQSHSAE